MALTWLAAACTGGAVAALVLALGRPLAASPARRRVERLWLPPPPAPSDEPPFAARVLRPLLEALARAAGRALPRTLVASVEARLRTAGTRTSAGRFVALWVGGGVLPPLMALALVTLGGSATRGTLLLVGVWGGAGAYLPWLLLRRRAERRTRAVDRALPDAIDLIVTSVEAGLGIQQAMLTVAQRARGPLSDEFGRVVGETRAGRARAEALREMARRTGSRDLALFVRAVTQAEQMGIAIGEVLRNQAAETRDRRRQRAREEAAKIPVKMTLPTIGLMLPTMFILVLTPVILNAIDSFNR